MLLSPLPYPVMTTENVVMPRILEDLPCYGFDVQAFTPVEEVVTHLQKNPELPGVLLRDHDQFIGAISRLKIMEWLGRPFGIELFFKKPVQNLLANLNPALDIYPSYTRINDAVEQALSRPPQMMYEPIAVSFGVKDLRLLDMHVLLQAQSRLLANANHTIERQVEIGKALSSSLETSAVLRMILEQMDTIIPYSRASVLLHRDGKMEFATSRGYPSEVDMDQARILVNASPIFKMVMKSRRVTSIEDAVMRMDWQHIPGTPPTRSWLGVPIFRADQALGMLSLSRLTVKPFSTDEADMAQLFASQAAVALSNAGLYEQVRRLNNELEDRVTDRTLELRKAYEKLSVLDRNKSDFIKISSNEIKAPLTAAAGYAQMLRLDSSLTPRARELTEGVVEGMQRLEEIVGTMLDVARLDSNEMHLDCREMDLYPVLLRLQSAILSQISMRRIELLIPDMTGLPRVIGDADAIYKALHHIVGNAIQYTPDGGKITLTARAPGLRKGKIFPSTLRLTCTDTGVGIDPLEQDLIFDKYYQTGKVMRYAAHRGKIKRSGPGLGLAVAKGIIEAHGGQLWVESSGHDEATCPGSAFHFILPTPRFLPSL